MHICSKFSLKCVESNKKFELVDFLMLGTYRQVLHLFINTITVSRNLKTKHMATNNMGTFRTITTG